MTNKSLPIAYLLWLFTGVFGGHRWYLGMRLRAAFLTARGVYFFGALFTLTKILNNYSFNEVIERVPTFVLEPIPMFVYFWYETSLEGGIMGSMILIFWSITVTLMMDIFWIHSTIKYQRKQENTTQEQVEVFD